jgi:hypothetical protein
MGMIAVIIFAIAGYFFYETFIKTTPTCTDGKQDQNELGVDCGGVCANLCPFQVKSIVPLWSRVVEITPGVYSAVAYVENQNVTAGVAQINYEFRVYDSDNLLAADPIDGTTFIGPNDKTAIFETPIQTGNRIPTNVFFSFTSSPVFTTTDPKYQVPQLSSANTKLTSVTTAPKLSADIVNNTLFNYSNIPVVALLYDANDNLISASQTQIDSIPQQSTQTVYFTWPSPFSEPVARIEIIPRLDPFIQK